VGLKWKTKGNRKKILGNGKKNRNGRRGIKKYEKGKGKKRIIRKSKRERKIN
jgi:hypothetical protein